MFEDINRTELQDLLREVEGANSFREAGRKELQDAFDGVGAVPLCPIDPHRRAMEDHIQANYRRLRTQLPGCNGRCVSYGCPNLIVMRCWMGIKDDIL
jgi:hypothetical protein